MPVYEDQFAKRWWLCTKTRHSNKT